MEPSAPLVRTRSRAGRIDRPYFSLAVNLFRWNFPARENCGWGAVDHRVGVFDAHAVSAGMVLLDIHHGVIRIPLRPVALPLEHHLNPGNRFRSDLLDTS